MSNSHELTIRDLEEDSHTIRGLLCRIELCRQNALKLSDDSIFEHFFHFLDCERWFYSIDAFRKWLILAGGQTRDPVMMAGFTENNSHEVARRIANHFAGQLGINEELRDLCEAARARLVKNSPPPTDLEYLEMWRAVFSNDCPENIGQLARIGKMRQQLKAAAGSVEFDYDWLTASLERECTIAIDLIQSNPARLPSGPGRQRWKGVPRQTANSKGNSSKRMSPDEANDIAMKLAVEDPDFALKPNARRWAAAIGCGLGTISKLTFWQATMVQTGKGRPGNRPRMIQVPNESLDVIGKTDSDLTDTIEKYRSDVVDLLGDRELAVNQLIGEQRADAKQDRRTQRQRARPKK